MQAFTEVRNSLKSWLENYSWIQFLMPYHIYILFGGIGLRFINDVLIYFKQYIHIFHMFSSIGYWLFILGVLLTLNSRNIKYLPYALWAYTFTILFPFKTFGFSALLSASIYAILGFLAFKYSAVTDE